jgi:hypothetical protein
MDTQTQIDNLIELAIVQRAELKQLVEQLPQLREHLTSEIEKTFEAVEPELRQELEEFFARKTEERVDLLRGEVSERVSEMLKSLELAAAAKYSALMNERAKNAELLAQAEQKIAEAAATIPGKVKEIVTDELSRFPRAGEIDQLRKEFAEPRGLNPRGRWSPTETYQKLDLVTYNGDSFVSNVNDNREKPSRSSSVWTLSAARGGGGGAGFSTLAELTATPTAGQLLIGTDGQWTNNTLTAGAGITITNAPGSITIDATVAQETLTATVTNAESVAITKGQVVYIFGATGNRPSVKLAFNTSDATSAKTFGVVSSASIAANGIGTVTCVGVVDGLNLGAYNDGDTVYLSATPGAFTATKPYAPNHLVYVGIIERANAGNGELYVRIQNGYELDEIHDVLISSPTNGQVLAYELSTDLWKNSSTATLSSVTGPTTTDLTLRGGSAGASLLLGQGTNGGFTFTPAGTGFVKLNTQATTALQISGDANGSSIISGNTALTGPKLLTLQGSNVVFSIGGVGEVGRFTTTSGNLLIGGTTDISGSGGLKVFGTTDANSTISGALQVLGGVGVAKSAWFGGTVYAGSGTSKAYIASDGSNVGYVGTTTGAFPVEIRPNQTTVARFTTTGNLLVGTTTDMSGSGGLTVFGTTNATSAITGALIVGNGTNGGIGVSGRSYFAEQVNSKAFESTGGPTVFDANGGLSLAGNGGSAYAAIKAYTNAAGTEKTISFNQSGGAGVNIGGIGAVAGGSLLASGTVTANNFLLGTGGPSIASTENARASRQGLISQGTSSANVGTFAAFGTGDYTAQVWVRLTTPTAPNTFLRIGQAGVGQSWDFGTTDSSPAGRVAVRNGDATAQLFGSTILQANTVYCVTAVRASGVTTIYLNGVSNGSGTLATNYTNAIGGLTVMPSAGFIGTPLIYNRALSAAEVLSLYEAGAPAQLDYGFGTNDSSTTVYSGQQLITGDRSTFASATGWTLFTGNSISGGKLNLVNLAYALCNNTNLRKGIRYRLTITIDSITGGTLRVYDGVNYTGVIGNTSGTKTLEYTMAADAPVFLRMEGGSAVVDDITIVPLGVLLAPDANQPGGGLAWYDTSGNNATITLPASGVNWNVRTSGKINAPLMVGGVDGGAKLNVYTPTTAEVGYLYGIRLSDESTTTLALGLQTPTGTVRPFIHGNVGLGLGTAGTIALNITSAQQVQVLASTASTGTSSGALVVSGGVGVAKSLNVGEAVTVAGGAFAAASFYKSASLGTVLSGATGSSYDLYITNPAGNYVMQVPTGTRNAQFAATLTTVGAITSGASISTSAPTGGSGAWELGVYSTTAPSATGYVTIEIGGVAYKLLASNV